MDLTPYIEYIEGAAKWFAAYTKDNPVVGGIFGAWCLGTGTYIFRQIPDSIYETLQRQFTVSITIHNRDEVFFHFLRWYEKEGLGVKARTLRINNGMWGTSKRDVILSAGFGHHYFWRGLRPFKLERKKEDSSLGTEVKEQITITTLGRSQKSIRDLIKAFIPSDERTDTRIYEWGSDGWKYSTAQPARPFDSVILTAEQKRTILEHIHRFKTDKEWYLKNGIPYRTGICTSGPPGTGKTSLVRALCAHLDRDLYRLSLNWVTDRGLEKALNSVDNNSIVIIEDIDTFGVTQTRKLDRSGVNSTPEIAEMAHEIEKMEGNPVDSVEPAIGNPSDTQGGFLTLSGVLNAIDGIAASNGRILIVTTNAPDKLDPALMREGRIDLVMHLTYLCDETFRGMFKRFFPDFKIPGMIVWKKGISPAKFQGLVIKNRDNPTKILKEVSAVTGVEVA